ncbi:unnamed protein product, partial [Mesorhabditis belari]|uniref:DM domain-containing protein n=1 Tax=Mesorhabditis belari TaxID=2138241 RepID=A0AAF3FNR2_9BILA
MPKEQYMCQLCANHGVYNQPKKGHKQKCLFKECPCSLCALNTKRRALDQIERQLKTNGVEQSSPTSSTSNELPIMIDTASPSPTFLPDLSSTSISSTPSTSHVNFVEKSEFFH